MYLVHVHYSSISNVNVLVSPKQIGGFLSYFEVVAWGGDAILVSGSRQLQQCAYRHSDQDSVVSISTFASTQLHAYTSHNVANLIYKHELLSSPSFLSEYQKKFPLVIF